MNNINSSQSPSPSGWEPNDIYKKIYKNLAEDFRELNKLRKETIPTIAAERLSKVLTPKQFYNNYNSDQRGNILKEQFIRKIPASELKPYLLADRTYLIHHFMEDDIPLDYYYRYEEIEKSLRFTSDEIEGEQIEQILAKLELHLVESLHALNLSGCIAPEDLSFLKNRSFDHLHEINCSAMSLEKIEGLPEKCKYRLLDFTDCSLLKDFSALNGVSVKRIDLSNCTGIRNWSFLLKVKDLGIIDITGCTQAKATPENLEILKQLKESGVTIHAKKGTLQIYNKHSDLVTYYETEHI